MLGASYYMDSLEEQHPGPDGGPDPPLDFAAAKPHNRVKRDLEEPPFIQPQPEYLNYLKLPQETFVLTSSVKSYQFNSSGIMHTLRTDITTSVVYLFSKHVEREAHRRYLDVDNQFPRCSMSPAIETDGDGLIVAFRVHQCWQKQTPRNRLLGPMDEIFVQHYDSSLTPQGRSYILGHGFPYAKTEWVDGPQDPRAFKYQGKNYLTFHAAIFKKETPDLHLLTTVFWDLEEDRPIIPTVKNNLITIQPGPAGQHDKNWMSLIIGDDRYFIQLLDPLLIIRCPPEEECEYVYQAGTTAKDFETPNVGVLRGSSSFKLYQWPYYLGMAHCTYTKSYSINLILFRVNPFRVVYVTEDIPIHEDFYSDKPRTIHINGNFYFPTSLFVESPDSVLIGAHANDYSSFLMRVRGLEPVLQTVIKRDQIANPPSGPPNNFLQNLFTPIVDNLFKKRFSNRWAAGLYRQIVSVYCDKSSGQSHKHFMSF